MKNIPLSGQNPEVFFRAPEGNFRKIFSGCGPACAICWGRRCQRRSAPPRGQACGKILPALRLTIQAGGSGVAGIAAGG
jgi:hypothetical protein